MLPRIPFRSSRPRTRSWLAASLATALAATLAAALPGAPAYAANPVTPGNFRGLGFDQCSTPSQTAMSAWIKSSPFRAAGIYISGNSRACRTQTNLTPTWVANQLRAGWHLMPITLGPQASCSTRFPRYGKSIDPTINPSTGNTYQAARAQGILEAQRAVAAARALGIVAGSTLFYDLEAFNTRLSSACSWSALYFLSYWTQELHRNHYASGYYSSAASGIRLIDDARVRVGNTITLPDQIWIADWNGQANTSSSYIRSDGWQPYRRAHQYQGGHNEKWGGVTINIDRNYLDLRTPSLPATAAPKPPATTSGPRYTGTSMSDPRCSPATINKPAYRRTGPGRQKLVVPLQCLLKQQGLYRYEVTGKWNAQTTTALHGFQARVRHPAHGYASRSDWVSLFVAGGSGSTLRTGSRSADVTRLQRSLNAASSAALPISGTYTTATRNAVIAYQRKVRVSATGTVSSLTWSALRAGRL